MSSNSGASALRYRRFVEDLRQKGKLDQRMFAVDISNVASVDPSDFFDRTEVVDDLRDIAVRVLRRVYGAAGGHSVMLLDTVMGGGKSHTLAYLRLLFEKRQVANARQDVRNILRQAGLSEVPEAKVVVFNGINADPRKGFDEQTPISQYFREGSIKDSIKRCIEAEGRPVVFLFDELVLYLSKREEARMDSWKSDLAHVRTLAAAVADTDNSALIVAAASDDPDRSAYQAVADTFKSLGRVAQILEPQNPVKDFVQIAKKQLIEEVDEKEAEQAAERTAQILRREGITPSREDYRRSYPFHPMLIQLFIHRLSQFRNFQKTREALKLLAYICATYKTTTGSYIGLGDVDLENKELQSAFTSTGLYEMSDLPQIVAKDVLGADAHLRRMLTAVYLYSLLPEKEKRGINSLQLYEALLPENGSASDLDKAMEEYEEGWAMYLEKNKENGRFYFSEEIKIWALIRQEAEKVADVDNQFIEVIKEFEKEFGEDFNVVYYKHAVGALKPDKFNLVFTWNPAYPEEDAKRQAENLIVDSKLENAVALVFPRSKADLEDILKKKVAVALLKKDYKNNRAIMDKLIEAAEKLNDSAIKSFVHEYTELYTMRNRKIEVWKFSPKELSKNGYRDSVVLLLQSEKEKAYFDVKDVGTKVLFEKLLGNKGESRVGEAYENVVMNSELPYLPRRVFNETLRLAVSQGVVALVEDGVILRDIYAVKDKTLMVSHIRAVEIEKAQHGTTNWAPSTSTPTSTLTPGPAPTPIGGLAIQTNPMTPAPATHEALLRVSVEAKGVQTAKNFLEQVEFAINLGGNGAITLHFKRDDAEVALENLPASKASKVKLLVEDLARLYEDPESKLEIKVAVDDRVTKTLKDKLIFLKMPVEWMEA